MKDMDYSNLIELENITVEDCIQMYNMKNMYTVIKNGRVVNFKKEEEK